jgi:hypothetical protein
MALDYEALAEVEDLDAAPVTSGEGEPFPGDEPDAGGVELVGELEDARWSDLELEGADPDAELPRRYEGLDVDEIETLARLGEGAAMDASSEGVPQPPDAEEFYP